jgi:hypothetical protein
LTKSLWEPRDPSLRPMTSDGEDDDERTRYPSTWRHQQFVLDKEGKIPLVPGREMALRVLGGKLFFDFISLNSQNAPSKVCGDIGDTGREGTGWAVWRRRMNERSRRR